MNEKTTAAETINGVSFDEYASAIGNLTQGMSEAQILEILGLEKSVWDDTMNKWGARLGELAGEDMAWMTRYGNIFANPKAGRFGAAASPAASIDELLQLVPNLTAHTEILVHQSVAAKYGFDPVDILAQYGLDLGKWGALNMHYLQARNQMSGAELSELPMLYQAMEQHFEQIYAASQR